MIPPARPSAFSQALKHAESQYRAGRLEEARHAFEQALALATDARERTDALLGFGIACAEWAHLHEYHVWTPPSSRIARRYPEKIRCFEAARKALEEVLAVPGITPDRTAKARYFLASARYARGDYAGACEALRTMLEQDGLAPELLVKGHLLLAYYLRCGKGA